MNSSEFSPPDLTVIVPVYNEAATVEVLLRMLFEVVLEKQIIVVDDGSCDGSAAVLQKLTGVLPFELVLHQRNRGKGAAIRSALPLARGRFTIIQDADLEYDPREIALLLEPLLVERAEVVYGSRYLGGSSGFSGRRHLDGGVKVLNSTVRFLYGQRITDEATCYKLFPTSLLRAMELECEGFEFCPEVTAKACRLGLEIQEIPISYSPRGIRAGKKIRWHDGWQAIRTLWKYRKWSGTWRPTAIPKIADLVPEHQIVHATDA